MSAYDPRTESVVGHAVALISGKGDQYRSRDLAAVTAELIGTYDGVEAAFSNRETTQKRPYPAEPISDEFEAALRNKPGPARLTITVDGSDGAETQKLFDAISKLPLLNMASVPPGRTIGIHNASAERRHRVTRGYATGGGIVS